MKILICHFHCMNCGNEFEHELYPEPRVKDYLCPDCGHGDGWVSLMKVENKNEDN